MNTYGLTTDQVQRVIEYVVQARDGMITKGEMANKIETVVIGEGDEPFADDLAALGITESDIEDEAAQVMNSTSTMARRG